MNEELNQKIKQNDESLPMPESQAVLANELNAGTHPFRITERKIEREVKLEGKTGTYTSFEVRARPLDVDLASGKSQGVFFSYNLKTSIKCGEFINNQGVTPEYLDGGRISLPGLFGSCFEAGSCTLRTKVCATRISTGIQSSISSAPSRGDYEQM